MKNFKFKINFISNFFKKNKIFKKNISFFEDIKKLFKFDNIKKKFFDAYSQFYLKKFKLKYLIFFISLIIFYYLIYLSFPGILHNKSDQNYLTKLLKDQYVLEFAQREQIPSVVCMGGGYSPNIKDIIEAHTNTFKIAQQIFL